jgi:hypothetical protein
LVEGIGDVYRYKTGQRKKAILRVRNFWNKEELNSFNQIHKFLRNENKNFFERRGLKINF